MALGRVTLRDVCKTHSTEFHHHSVILSYTFLIYLKGNPKETGTISSGCTEAEKHQLLVITKILDIVFSARVEILFKTTKLFTEI